MPEDEIGEEWQAEKRKSCNPVCMNSGYALKVGLEVTAR
jgi:hypothetical protein